MNHTDATPYFVSPWMRGAAEAWGTCPCCGRSLRCSTVDEHDRQCLFEDGHPGQCVFDTEAES